MAENDEILGISGHLDTRDIDKGVDKIVKDFNKVGEAANTAGKKVEGSSKQAANEFSSAGKKIETAGTGIEGTFKKIAAAAGIAFGLSELKAFASQVMKVRGEFQQLEVAFKTMLGSEEKAANLMAQITKTAATTPFDLKGVAAGAKSLMAYGTAAENVNEMLVRLGDIAAGMSIPLNDLVYLYGTTMVQGRMFTQDLRQFQGRGIPIAEELAKILNVAKEKIPELVTAGKVTSDVFHQAILNMTADGSKFGGLMEAQSKTISGQISNIEDAIDMMFNEIGQKSEGIINESLSVVSALVENYEKVGKVIISLVGVYGSYRAALIAVALSQNIAKESALGYTLAQQVQYKWTLLCEKAQKLLNATMLNNPYVLAAVAIASMVALMWNLHDSTTAEEKAQKNLEKTLGDLEKKQKEYNDETQKAIQLAQDDSAATLDRDGAMQTLIERYPEIIKKYIDEEGHLKDILKFKKEIAEFDGKKQREEKTETLKNEGLTAWSNYNRLADLYQKQLNGTYTDSERAEINKIRQQYGEETGDSGASLKDMRDYYKSKAATRRKQYARNLTENKIFDFTKEGGTLEGYTDDQLAALQKRLRNANAEKYKKTSVMIEDLDDYLTYDDRTELLTRVTGMIEARKNAKEGSTKNFIDEAKAEYKKEKKASEHLRSLQNADKRKNSTETIKIGNREVKVSEMGQEQYEKAIKEQAEKEKTAREKYEKLSGQSVRTENKSAEDAKNRSAKQIEDELKYQEELSKITIEGRRALEDAKIAEIEDDAERERAERKKQYERTLEDIALQQDEIYKEIYQKRKQDYEVENKGKKYENTTAGAAGWSAKEMKGTLTEEETAYYNERNKKNEGSLQKAKAEWERYQKEVERREQESLINYLSKYGSMEEQKAAIAKKYDMQIAATSDVILQESLKKQKEQELSELNMKEFQQSIDWETVFNRLDRLSTKALVALKEKLRDALDAKDITAENAKVIAEKIEEIEDKITSRTDAWGSLLPILKERKKLAEEAYTAEKNYQRSLLQRTNASANVSTLKMRASTVLSKNGLDSTEITSEKIKELLKSMDPTTDAFKQLSDISTQLKIAEDGLVKSTEEAAKALAKKNSVDTQIQNFSSFKEGTKKGIENAGGEIQYGLNQATELNELIDTIGLHDTEFGKGVKEFTDGANHFASAIAKWNSGDYVGAITDGIKGIQDWGSLIERIGGFSFNGSNADEVRARDRELIEANQALEKSINKLRETIDKENGQEAIDASIEAKQKQEQYNQNLLAQWENDMQYHDAHHSNSSNWNLWDSTVSDINKALAEYAKKNGTDAKVLSGVKKDWRELMTLTPEEMAYIRDNYNSAWKDMVTEGDSAYAWVYQAIDEYANQAGKVAEIDEQLAENLTMLTVDGLHDSFLNELMDMERDVDDFSDDFSESLMKAVMNARIGNELDDELEAWRKKMAQRMEANKGKLTDEDVEELREDWNKIVEMGIAIRDETARVTGYTGKTSDQQSSTFNSAQNITYEQADAMTGSIIAQTIILEQGLQQMIGQSTSLSNIEDNVYTMNSSIENIDANIQTIVETQTSMNTHLANIEVNTSVLPDMLEEIQSMKKAIKEQ